MLFILEMANNHQGSVERGKEIIKQFSKVIKNFPQFRFAFKFQRRELETFLHPDYASRLDIPYVKRFVENQITIDQLRELKDYASKLGFLTICTPFDEEAVKVVKDLKFDYLKIGSCSITDWPLLNKIVETNLPVIGSVGGTSLETVDKVVSFFKNRQVPLMIMYCVGLYPCLDSQLCLDKLDELIAAFPTLQIGFSTHERPDNYDAVQLAIAKGATIFEKHVDIEHINQYSITPEEYTKYLEAANAAITMCTPNMDVQELEEEKLRTLQRGAYLKKDVVAGDVITKDDLFFAFPIQNDFQFTASDCSKHISFKAVVDIQKNAPLCSFNVSIVNNSATIERIKSDIKEILAKNNIVYPRPAAVDISHHYGLDNFNKYGMCLLTLVNLTYCKKLLILKGGQTNPEHHHKQKQETFFVLAGEAIIVVNGVEHRLKPGSLIHIKQGETHSISADIDTIIEELSSTHIPNDSFYTDSTITQNHNRKTTVYI